jgi:hypothetical protein
MWLSGAIAETAGISGATRSDPEARISNFGEGYNAALQDFLPGEIATVVCAGAVRQCSAACVPVYHGVV